MGPHLSAYERWNRRRNAARETFVAELRKFNTMLEGELSALEEEEVPLPDTQEKMCIERLRLLQTKVGPVR